MSGKNQYPSTLNWQSADPSIGFLPNPNQGGSIPSGTISGVMASTNSIYSQIIDVSKMDNIGAEITWSGTPAGTLSVLVSNSGQTFYPLTFSPGITQPAGSASGLPISITQLQFKYIMFKYVNASGSGTLTGYLQLKDLN